ncbi:MAG TPA: hypothetical protein PKD84_09410 [Propionicimonas sp.]|nr:hypothetical protein [Propionicimonas sp.]
MSRKNSTEAVLTRGRCALINHPHGLDGVIANSINRRMQQHRTKTLDIVAEMNPIHIIHITGDGFDKGRRQFHYRSQTAQGQGV